MLRYEATLQPGTDDAAWSLLWRPDRWHEWAPHLRGAWGLDDPATGEVVPGCRGAVKLLGVVPVPVRVTAKERGTAWSWSVGGVVDMDHRVEDGRAVIVVDGPRPVLVAVAVAYGPLIALLLASLSRTAAARRPPTRTGTPAG